MVRKCRKPKKEKETRKCYKCDKVGHLAKDCRSKQKIKIKRNQEEFCQRFGVDIIQQMFVHSNSQNRYVIPNQRNNKVRELNMHTNIKTKNGKELQLQTLVDSGCTHTRINKQLVKEEKIKTRPIDRSFEVFNADGTKNREVT